MDSERLLKFIEYFPDYLSALLRSFWASFSETAVYRSCNFYLFNSLMKSALVGGNALRINKQVLQIKFARGCLLVCLLKHSQMLSVCPKVMELIRRTRIKEN